MKEINRGNIKAPRSVLSSADGTYKDNYLQATVGSGVFIIIDDVVKSNFLKNDNLNSPFKLCLELKFGTVLSPLGRLLNLGEGYSEGSYIADLNPIISIENVILPLDTTSIESVLRVRDNKIPINGVNINLSISDLTNKAQLLSYSNTFFEAHKHGLLTFLRIDTLVIDFIDLIKIGAILAPDMMILSSKVSYNSEQDKFADLTSGLIMSDEAVSQSQDLFTNIDLFKSKGARGILLSESIFTRDYEDSKKLLESIHMILYDDKDPDDAYDHLIS